MKKLISVVLTIVLVSMLALAGCKAKEKPAEPNAAATPAPTAPSK